MSKKTNQCQLNTRCILEDGHPGRCVFRLEDEAALAEFFAQLAAIERRDEGDEGNRPSAGKLSRQIQLT